MRKFRLWLARLLLPKGWMLARSENFANLCAWAVEGNAMPSELLDDIWPDRPAEFPGSGYYAGPVSGKRKDGHGA